MSKSSESDGQQPGATEDETGSALHRELAGLAAQGAAVLLVSEDGRRVVWSTPAGAALFGGRSPDELETRELDPRLVPVDRLAELARGEAPLAGTRLVRLRLHVGRRSEAVTLACRRAVLRSGQSVLVAIGFGLRPLPGRIAPTDTPPPRLDLLPAAGEPVATSGAIAEIPRPGAPTLDTLRNAAGGRAQVRFVWSSMADGALGGFAELARIVGPDNVPAPGEDWASLARRLAIDPQGRLAETLATQRTFTGVDCAWPVDGAPFRVAVSLSGVPALDADRRFQGYRGFGLCRLDRELDAPDAPRVEEEAAGHAASPAEDAPPPVPAEPAVEKDGALEPTELSLPEAAPPGHAAAPPSVAETPQAAAGLQPDEDLQAHPEASAEDAAAASAATSAVPGAGAQAAGPPEADAPAPQPEPEVAAPDATVVEAFVSIEDARVQARPGGKVVHLHGSGAVDMPALTRTERHAFREIARALGARIEGHLDDDEAGRPADEGPAAGARESQEQVHEAPAAGDEPTAPHEGVETDGLSVHARLLFDRLPIGILVSRGSVPIVMNRTLLDLLGYESIDAFFDEGGVPHLFRGHPPEPIESGETASDSTTVSLETRLGEPLQVDARLQTISWDGLPATLMSFRRAIDPDVTPRLRATELELRQSRTEARELRAMLDTATDGVLTLDETGRILSINRSGEALFGYDQREIAGEMFISLLAPDSHATALDYLEGLKSNGVASILNDGREVIGRVRQGGRIPLFMTLGAIAEPPERKYCAVLRDLTPWRKAESELVEARRVAEEASAQKSDFLAKISHEIRTPLSAIIGFAEVMTEERFGPIGNERYLEYLRDIHASGAHVISLVNDLLDLSKIEAGRFDLTFVSVDVNEIVSRSVALMQPQAGTGRVVVRSALSPRLPRIVADERSLRQIVLNLLSNAIKFTDPGGQVIVSTTLTDPGEVVIRIRDTGIGMTDKDIETALEPFRQVATARRAGGTGLGLPLTKALVEANRASLSIRSAKDSGTLVEVTFPTTRVLAE